MVLRGIGNSVIRSVCFALEAVVSREPAAISQAHLGLHWCVVRVAIDIRRITEFGVGTYTRNAIRTLARLDHDNEYFLIGIPGKLGDIGELPQNFITVRGQPNEFSVASYLELHRILKQNGCDLLHVPHLFWKPQG